jgi:hypothetical protein
LKIFYADIQTTRGDLDPHRFLSNRVAKMIDNLLVLLRMAPLAHFLGRLGTL